VPVLVDKLEEAISHQQWQSDDLLTATLVKLADARGTVDAFKAAEGLALVSRLAFVIGEIDAPEVRDLMRPLANEELDLQSFFANKYLAAKGDLDALAQLNENYFLYAVPSFVWSEAVWVFGEQKYEPATCNIVESLNAAYLGLAEQAAIALKAIHPDSFASLNENSRLSEWQQAGAQLCTSDGNP